MGQEGFTGNESDLREFLRLADTPVRHPDRTVALQRWRRYKQNRFLELYRERHPSSGRSVLVKGWSGIAFREHLVDLSGAQLNGICLGYVDLRGVRLDGASMRGAWLKGAQLEWASLRGVDFGDLGSEAPSVTHGCGNGPARLIGADLRNTDLSGARLVGVDLSDANLVGATVSGADLSHALVYGSAAWDLKGTPAAQRDLIITPPGESTVTVDELKVAQFIYLLLNNPNIRGVIDTIGDKGVLVLGRFGDRKPVLDKLRARLRELGLVPMVFDFERPASKDFTETVRTLAGMSAFIIADITAPKSVPQEAEATVPDYMIPFVPIIQGGETPWAMFQDLWIKYREWVFEPLEYPSIDALISKLGSAVVQPALERRKVLLARRAESMGTRSLDAFDVDEINDRKRL